MAILNSRVFSGMRAGNGGGAEDAMYNDMPVYDEGHDAVVWEGRQGSGFGEGISRSRTGSTSDRFGAAPQRASTWQDDIYDRPSDRSGPPSRSNTFAASRGGDDEYSYSDRPSEKRAGPGRPAAPKPVFGAKQAALKANEAVAVFNFDADQPGDLGFKKGDVITILKKTDSDNDWW